MYQRGKTKIRQHYCKTFYLRQFQIDVKVSLLLLFDTKADNWCLWYDFAQTDYYNLQVILIPFSHSFTVK